MLSRTPRRLYLAKAWEVVKRETKKAVQGCKILWHDGKFLARKKYAIVMHEEQYSLKEKKLMAKTSVDLVKMIPFSFFIVVPFSEIFLPPSLYLFPNMIPSTFLSKSKIEARMAEVMGQRPQAADVIHAYMLERSKTFKDNNATLATFLRADPQEITLKSLEPYIDVFRTELSFAKMSNEQLMSTCAFLGIQPWTGFKTFERAIMVPLSLVFGLVKIKFPRQYNPKMFPFKQIYRNFVYLQLTKYLRKMREEDTVILKEDLNKIEPELLRLVCYERGIDIENSTDAELKDQLNDWLRMSTYPSARGLPSTNLLVMAQALQYVQDTLVDVEVPHVTAKVESVDLTDRVLKFNPTELSQMLADLETKQLLTAGDRERCTKQLTELLDKKLFMDQHDRIRSLIERLSELPGEFVVEQEGPMKPQLTLNTEEAAKPKQREEVSKLQK